MSNATTGFFQKVVRHTRRKFRYYFPTSRRVGFIVCGTQKGGTTALFAYLGEHSEICVPDTKEIHYFDADEHFADGKPNYARYHAHFDPKTLHKIMGEATPIYMYWNSAPQRIHEYNPDVKLIALLRNPIERAYSHWNMERQRGYDDFSFWDAIQNEQERCKEALPQQHRVYSYVERGFYAQQLKRLWEYFPKEQVLVLKNSELQQNPGPTLNRICDYLGISHFPDVDAKTVHARPYKSRISDQEKEYLKTVYEDDIRELESLLGWDCSDWLNS